jgi:hypothetical protein
MSDVSMGMAVQESQGWVIASGVLCGWDGTVGRTIGEGQGGARFRQAAKIKLSGEGATRQMEFLLQHTNTGPKGEKREGEDEVLRRKGDLGKGAFAEGKAGLGGLMNLLSGPRLVALLPASAKAKRWLKRRGPWCQWQAAAVAETGGYVAKSVDGQATGRDKKREWRGEKGWEDLGRDLDLGR